MCCFALDCDVPIRLKRRIETLVRTIEKELEGPLKKDKEKRRASVGGGGKRKASLDGPAAGPGKVRSTKLPNSLHMCILELRRAICSTARPLS